jgi:tetratricopeptide (TPR) repeat protein
VENVFTPRALAAHEEGLAISRQLAGSNPTNTQHQLDLSTDLEAVADIRLRSPDTVGALAAYEGSLAIRRRISDADQNNRKLQQDLSVTLEKIGDLRQSEKNDAAALALYEESLDIRHTLADCEKVNVQRQWDVLLTLKKVANAKLNASDTCGALTAFEESLAIARNLLNANKTSNISAALLSFRKLNDAFFPLQRYRSAGSAFLRRLSARAWAGVKGSQHATESMRLALKRLLFESSALHNASSTDRGRGSLRSWLAPFQYKRHSQEQSSTVLAQWGRKLLQMTCWSRVHY